MFGGVFSTTSDFTVEAQNRLQFLSTSRLTVVLTSGPVAPVLLSSAGSLALDGDLEIVVNGGAPPPPRLMVFQSVVAITGRLRSVVVTSPDPCAPFVM